MRISTQRKCVMCMAGNSTVSQLTFRWFSLSISFTRISMTFDLHSPCVCRWAHFDECSNGCRHSFVFAIVFPLREILRFFYCRQREIHLVIDSGEICETRLLLRSRTGIPIFSLLNNVSFYFETSDWKPSQLLPQDTHTHIHRRWPVSRKTRH